MITEDNFHEYGEEDAEEEQKQDNEYFKPLIDEDLFNIWDTRLI